MEIEFQQNGCIDYDAELEIDDEGNAPQSLLISPQHM